MDMILVLILLLLGGVGSLVAMEKPSPSSSLIQNEKKNDQKSLKLKRKEEALKRLRDFFVKNWQDNLSIFNSDEFNILDEACNWGLEQQQNRVEYQNLSFKPFYSLFIESIIAGKDPTSNGRRTNNALNEIIRYIYDPPFDLEEIVEVAKKNGGVFNEASSLIPLTLGRFNLFKKVVELGAPLSDSVIIKALNVWGNVRIFGNSQAKLQKLVRLILDYSKFHLPVDLIAECGFTSSLAKRLPL